VSAAAPSSLRAQLLLGILLPVAAFIAIHSVNLYREAMQAANTAYDRTLLASAKTIGEQLQAQGHDEHARLIATVPFSALEAFEADNASRMYYRVSSMQGELVSGFGELRFWHGRIPQRPPYAALVDFYDDLFRGQPVRVAVLLQPVASANGRAMAVVQVAETLQLREGLAHQLLRAMLWRHAALLLLIALVTVWVVQRATAPVRALGRAIEARSPQDLSPIDAPDAPRELRPLLDATSSAMARLRGLIQHQKRFVRDSAHQLRTPLAVLKVQLQSAQRGDLPPEQALAEMADTVERATTLANQMLALSKVEQLRQQPELTRIDLADTVRQIALDLSPLIGEKDLDFELHTEPVGGAGGADDSGTTVLAHPWMLQELTRNLLHNAIRHSPRGAALSVSVTQQNQRAQLLVRDHGPGIAAELHARLFSPFVSGDTRQGVGLGLVICLDIVLALGGELRLDNRVDAAGQVLGLDARAQLPLASNAAHKDLS
jgi:two-component system sensor histidine kinase TctE